MILTRLRISPLLGIIAMLVIAGFALGACSGEIDLQATPEIAYGELICEQCGMIISDDTHAAAYRLSDGQLRIFDDLGDMVLYHRVYGENVAVFWVHDYQTGDWLQAPGAYFVATEDLITPMAHGIAAFTYEAGAEHFANEHTAPIYRWDDLLAGPLQDLPRHTD